MAVFSLEKWYPWCDSSRTAFREEGTYSSYSTASDFELHLNANM